VDSVHVGKVSIPFRLAISTDPSDAWEPSMDAQYPFQTMKLMQTGLPRSQTSGPDRRQRTRHISLQASTYAGA
jgi:hypothetical protein